MNKEIGTIDPEVNFKRPILEEPDHSKIWKRSVVNIALRDWAGLEKLESPFTLEKEILKEAKKQQPELMSIIKELKFRGDQLEKKLNETFIAKLKRWCGF